MYLLINLPKIIAIESLAIMPKIAPIINTNLYDGYCIPKPREAKNVLSPNSPTKIERAIIRV